MKLINPMWFHRGKNFLLHISISCYSNRNLSDPFVLLKNTNLLSHNIQSLYNIGILVLTWTIIICNQDFDSSIYDMIIKIRPQNLFSVKQAAGNISAKRTQENLKNYLEILWQGSFQFRD